MSFAVPWLLLGLLVLPALWWLLRVTPPAPRRLTFPPARLLAGLPPTVSTAARTPPWLLAVRLLAAGLLIVGLADPRRAVPPAVAGTGPLLAVIDDGWAAAADFPARLAAMDAVLAEAVRADRPVALLPTAARATPRLLATADAAAARAALAVLRPQPWPTDRAAAAAAVAAWGQHGPVLYLGDGLDGADWEPFARALSAVGPIVRLDPAHPPATLMLPALAAADGIVARAARADAAAAQTVPVLAQSADGRTIARADLMFAAGDATARVLIALPPEPRNRLARLVLAEPAGDGLAAIPGAGSVALLDPGTQRRSVALPDARMPAASADAGDGQDAPLRGAGYYLRRALAPLAEVSGGPLQPLLARHPSVLILPDRPLAADTEETTSLAGYVAGGGLLLRFAGPEMAAAAAAGAAPDPLLPVPLLGADRQMGGTMSWDRPQMVAEPPAGSPLAGLAIPADVQIMRQVLADPQADLATAAWLRLRDGTPLVTARTIGRGRVMLVHVTANADWSSLPLSGLYLDLLGRVLSLSAGDATRPTSGAALAPGLVMDGFGALGPPGEDVRPIPAGALGTLRAGPTHPPGLYGPEADRRAFDLAANLAAPAPSPPIPGATVRAMAGGGPPLDLGPPLLALAVLLLALDTVLSLGARGLLRRAALAAFLGSAAVGHAAGAPPPAALSARLGWVRTGDPARDDVSASGLAGLTAFVRARTSAELDAPDGVVPGRDDLSLYPLLYWPLPDARPAAMAITALNGFMARGGILVIDTRDGGGTADTAAAALRALARPVDGVWLSVPALAPVSTQHVLSRTFYLLRGFPGRYEGGPVWVARDEDQGNDGVSPVVIGANDWAAAWAIDAQGQAPFATLPGGERQRTLAFRFGTNLVVYALTGNYKNDQVHLPALLKRLGR